MSESDEKLSVLLDEYSNNETSRAVLDEVTGDVNLQYQVRRYQMIGDVMRHELPEQINLDLSHQIMSQVREIQINDTNRSNLLEDTDRKESLWAWARLKPLAGFAVAATVAVVSITLWQSASIETQGQPVDNATASIEQKKIDRLVNLPVDGGVQAVSSNLNNGTRWQTSEDSPALQQKLNAYLVNHTEYSIPMQGLIPQARVAGFDSQK